jgi:hypothetical protein
MTSKIKTIGTDIEERRKIQRKRILKDGKVFIILMLMLISIMLQEDEVGSWLMILVMIFV